VAAAFGGGKSEHEVYPRCVDLLSQCGLADKANRRAGSLTLIDRKRLELARALRHAAARCCCSTRSPAASPSMNAPRWSS